MSDLDPHPACSCEHPTDCGCTCHGRFCDPAENACDIAFLPDEGGLAFIGCPACTPGEGAPHLAACPAVAPPSVSRGTIGPAPRPFA